MGKATLQVHSDASDLASELQSAINELRLQKFAIDEHAIVAITDPSGVITYVNDKFCTISKYDRDELIGKTHRIINSGYHPKQFFIDMWKRIASGETWHGEVCNKAKDGDLYWVDTTIVPFKDENGRITSYTAIRADITERKATELKLAETNAQLKKTNEELEQFVYTASHDLKSPIVTLQGYISLIRSDLGVGKTDRVLGFIDRLDVASIKLRDCVNDLLELSRAGYIAYQPVKIDMNRLAQKLIQSHELEIRELNVQVSVDEELPEVYFDLQRMEDILDNLITNALRYGMTAEHPTLEILGHVHENAYLIAVKDNGIGIESRYHEKIFNIFERIDTTKDGTGIGLAIVKKLMTRNGGRVWIESQPGTGSAFWLAFPIYDESAQTEAHPVHVGDA